MAWKPWQSYSADLRSRVLAAVDGGNPAKAVAQLFQVSVSYIYKALARREATGETEARPQRNQEDAETGRASTRPKRPRWYAGRTSPWKSCAPGCCRSHGVSASLGLMHKTLARLGLTLKKSRGGPRNRTGPTLPSSEPTGVPNRAR